jgi:hypothetical protein
MTDLYAAYDWIRLVEQVRAQLGQAREKIQGDRSDPLELRWLGEAEALLDAGAEVRAQTLAKALDLPELAEAREEEAEALVGPWADAIEHLHAGVVFHAGLRSPLVEALFPHRKFDVLRRADVSTARAYGEDFMRRLKSSYIDRLLAQEDFAFAKQGVEQVLARYQPISAEQSVTLGDEDRAALIASLDELARGAELMIKRARSLVEAALAAHVGAFQELAIKSKPKSRAPKLPKATVAPVVETPPPAVEAKAKPKKSSKPKVAKPAEGSA